MSLTSAAASPPCRRSRPVPRAVLGAAAVLLGLLPAGAASAAPTPSPGPQLSIAVDDGRPAAKAGDRLTYTVTLTNLGTTRVRDLTLTQSVPAGAKLVDAGAGGDLREGQVRWEVDLQASQKRTVKTTLELGRTPEQVLRLATVACASTSAKAAPVVCAADSNLLPAGRTAQAEQAEQDEQAQRAGRASSPWWYAAAAAAGLALLVVATVVLVRLRRPATATTAATTAAAAPDVEGDRRPD